MQIHLASPRGFCAGVIMAIRTVEETLRIVGPPLYVYHEIVHNRHVVGRFQDQGVIFVNHWDDVPEQSTVVFSAHGVSPQVRRNFEQRRCTVIDATCPLVTKVHNEAGRYAQQGYQIVLIGHAGHDEVVGTMGQAPAAISIVETQADVAKLPFTAEDKLTYLTQTTLSTQDAATIIRALKLRFPNIKAPPSSDICYATTNRQQVVEDHCRAVDLVLVVGSDNSSNSLRLVEIAVNAGTAAHLIDDVGKLEPAWFDDVDAVFVTAGASAPEHLVQDIIAELVRSYAGVLDPPITVDEGMYFDLPRSLRALEDGSVGNCMSPHQRDRIRKRS